jgi:hypothetical protein
MRVAKGGGRRGGKSEEGEGEERKDKVSFGFPRTATKMERIEGDKERTLVSMHSKPLEAPSMEQAVWEVGQRLRWKMALLRRARARPD